MPKVSVIIPTHNRVSDLIKTINYIQQSDFKDFDITVVDDASTDNTYEVMTEFDVHVISLNENRGPAFARNYGAKNTQGELIAFIDSDISISSNTISKAVETFRVIPWLTALIGIPDKIPSFINPASFHFNSRTSFNFSKMGEWTDITWGSFTMIRREFFEKIGGYNENLKTAGIEDNELGYLISQNNGTILKQNDLVVRHRKKISFVGMLVNDFKRTVDRVFLMFRMKKVGSIIRSGRFVSTPIDQLIAPFIAPLVFLHPLFFVVFLITQFRYLKYIYEIGYGLYIIPIIPLIFIDMLVVFTALVWGTLKWLMR